jgi:hypothetical protein
VKTGGSSPFTVTQRKSGVYTEAHREMKSKQN